MTSRYSNYPENERNPQNHPRSPLPTVSVGNITHLKHSVHKHWWKVKRYAGVTPSKANNGCAYVSMVETHHRKGSPLTCCSYRSGLPHLGSDVQCNPICAFPLRTPRYPVHRLPQSCSPISLTPGRACHRIRVRASVMLFQQTNIHM